jgi:hypothetical protein
MLGYFDWSARERPGQPHGGHQEHFQSAADSFSDAGQTKSQVNFARDSGILSRSFADAIMNTRKMFQSRWGSGAPSYLSTAKFRWTENVSHLIISPLSKLDMEAATKLWLFDGLIFDLNRGNTFAYGELHPLSASLH